MGYLWNFFKAGVLMTNSVAILHEKRFLRKYGWDEVDRNAPQTVKNQLIGFLHAAQYLRIPLIAVNILTILLELLLG